MTIRQKLARWLHKPDGAVSPLVKPTVCRTRDCGREYRHRGRHWGVNRQPIERLYHVPKPARPVRVGVYSTRSGDVKIARDPLAAARMDRYRQGDLDAKVRNRVRTAARTAQRRATREETGS